MHDESTAHPVALVTGGAKGLGYAIVQRLARAGATVVIADVDRAAANAARQQLVDEGRTIDAVGLDVTVSAEVDRVVADTIERYGRLDYLVNNAGLLGSIAPLWDVSDEALHRVLAVNVLGVFASTRAAARVMRSRRSGAIVTVASTAGKEGPAELSSYAASKAAVIAATKSWAKELAPFGIRVNCVSPTLIGDSGMGAEMTDRYRTASVERIPMGRPARLDEVASVIHFLLSDDASFVTGQCYDVSGGRSVY